MKRFWISWYQPTEDFRPLIYPAENTLGYWCSGFSEAGNVMCALIEATNQSSAYKTITKSWPEAVVFRFCDEVDKDWKPGDRFPVAKWMPLYDQNKKLQR